MTDLNCVRCGVGRSVDSSGRGSRGDALDLGGRGGETGEGSRGDVITTPGVWKISLPPGGGTEEATGRGGGPDVWFPKTICSSNLSIRC